MALKVEARCLAFFNNFFPLGPAEAVQGTEEGLQFFS
jgi:hypothetical protein